MSSTINELMNATSAGNKRAAEANVENDVIKISKTGTSTAESTLQPFSPEQELETSNLTLPGEQPNSETDSVNTVESHTTVDHLSITDDFSSDASIAKLQALTRRKLAANKGGGQQSQQVNKQTPSQKSLFTYLSEPNRRFNSLPSIDENKPVKPTGKYRILRKYTK